MVSWSVWPQLDYSLLVFHRSRELSDEFLYCLLVLVVLESEKLFLDSLVDGRLEVVLSDHGHHLISDFLFDGSSVHVLLSHHGGHEQSDDHGETYG